MLQRVESKSIAPSSGSKEQSCKFGTVVRALWPIKPAYCLSQKMGCSERHAQFLIDGERGVSLDAVLVIIDEIRGKD